MDRTHRSIQIEHLSGVLPWGRAAQLGFDEKILDFTPKSHIISIEKLKLSMQLDTSDARTAVPATSLMEAADVAKWLGVSEQWVRDHGIKREPRLNSVRVGRLLRFRREDVEEFITRCRL
jgi:excisionase family DNA binding protein